MKMDISRSVILSGPMQHAAHADRQYASHYGGEEATCDDRVSGLMRVRRSSGVRDGKAVPVGNDRALDPFGIESQATISRSDKCAMRQTGRVPWFSTSRAK